MASNTLTLTEGSERTLSEIFPSVEHIQRFNLRTDRARSLLATAEQDMSTMGMSYALALHEDFAKTCLGWLVPLGKLTRRQWRDSRTVDVHEKLEQASGQRMNVDSLKLFHLVRIIRNCHIHAGGRASAELERYSSALTPDQRTTWEDLTGEPYAVMRRDDPAHVGVGGLTATLAIGKRLSYDINLCLQKAIPRSTWADMAAGEYFALGAKPATHVKALRAVKGHIRGRYDALAFTDEELEAAIDRAK